MRTGEQPTPAEIRAARADNPKMRERDLAARLGIAEAELVAAFCGEGAIRVDPDYDKAFPALKEAGPVLALTRNEGAVHEKIGVYEKYSGGKHAGLVLGEQIDLRMFPKHWRHAFAVERRDGGEIRRSLQYFDAAGNAVHKIHVRPETDLSAWQRLIDALAVDDQSQTLEVEPPAPGEPAPAEVPVEELRDRWSRMTDTHQFALLLRALRLPRHAAVASVGEDYAWQIDNDAVVSMMEGAAASQLPIMCFVGNRGCVQIFSGPVRRIVEMGPWLNVLDPDFNLHLRRDRVASTWLVTKPTKLRGPITSLELFDADGEMVCQFFGARAPGATEREEWRALAHRAAEGRA